MSLRMTLIVKIFLDSIIEGERPGCEPKKISKQEFAKLHFALLQIAVDDPNE